MDTVHDPKAKPASAMADKVISFTSGTIKDMFEGEEGLRYDHSSYYDISSEKNFDPSDLQKMADMKKKDEATEEEDEDEVPKGDEKVEKVDTKKQKEVKQKGVGKNTKAKMTKASSDENDNAYIMLREKNIADRERQFANLGAFSCSSLAKEEMMLKNEAKEEARKEKETEGVEAKE